MSKIHLLLLLIVAFVLPSKAQSQDQPSIDCGMELELTAIGTRLKGRIIAPGGGYCITGVVSWYNDKTGQLIQQGPVLDYDITNYGHYTISAKFQSEIPGGEWGCSGFLKQDLLLVQPACMQPFPGTGNMFCPTVFAPVCGCNGATYNNECEAKSAGVSKWWAGECGTPPTPNCGVTDFDIEIVSGSPQEGYWVRFKNLTSGTFTNVQLEFGDSCQLFQTAQWANKLHHYPKGGIYQATLTAWNSGQPGCVSSVTKTFATDAYSFTEAALPYYLDYVLPGDANKDGKANAYDLLDISKGYSSTGAPRPEASIDWAPQYAPNWPNNQLSGKNYKHLDGNGDGTVNEFDTQPLEFNYQPIDPLLPTPYNAQAPKIFTRFNQDTIFVDAANPQQIEINADLVIGASDQPVFGLYGVACALRYPEFVAHNPVMFYDPTFFGSSNYVLSLGRDYHLKQQYDAGFSHKSGNGVNGYGNIAKIQLKADFIIIIDIIDRESQKLIPVTIPVEGIKAIDQQGNEIQLSPVNEPDTLWIKLINDTTTNTTDLSSNSTVKIYPNPAQDAFDITSSTADVETFEVYNVLGQRILTQQNVGIGTTHVDTSTWEDGVYTIRLRSAGNVTEEKMVISASR